MTKSGTVYVLDPYHTEFREQFIDSFDTATIRAIIGCDAVDSLSFDSDHTLYYDDEGLQDGLCHYVTLEGYPDPLVGNLVLAANDGQRGPTPLLPLQEALARFQCFRPVIDPIIKSDKVTIGDVTSRISAVDHFVTRIENCTLRIVEKGNSSSLNCSK